MSILKLIEKTLKLEDGTWRLKFSYLQDPEGQRSGVTLRTNITDGEHTPDTASFDSAIHGMEILLLSLVTNGLNLDDAYVSKSIGEAMEAIAYDTLA